jgi:hypothetical protein
MPPQEALQFLNCRESEISGTFLSLSGRVDVRATKYVATIICRRPIFSIMLHHHLAFCFRFFACGLGGRFDFSIAEIVPKNDK